MRRLAAVLIVLVSGGLGLGLGLLAPNFSHRATPLFQQSRFEMVQRQKALMHAYDAAGLISREPYYRAATPLHDIRKALNFRTPLPPATTQSTAPLPQATTQAKPPARPPPTAPAQ